MTTEKQNLKNFPNHIAIIMDGNRRWARKNHLPSIAGHRKGAETLRKIIEHAGQIGLKYLTVYAFSSENWDRPIYEVTGVMTLLKTYLKKEVPHLHKNNVKIKFLGERSKLSSAILTLMDQAETLTQNNTGLTFCPALNYGSWEELTVAVRKIGHKIIENNLDPSSISQELIMQHLFTKNIPNPDLLIRTGGEKRLSNFLLLQLAYAEFVFNDIYWPDYTIEALNNAIQEYQNRERRFGT
jgi:undecaprenyl diphosphate synthase